MPDYAALKAEISLSKYEKMSDEEIASELQQEIRIQKDINVSELEGYLNSRLLMDGLLSFVAKPPEDVNSNFLSGLKSTLRSISSIHTTIIVMSDPVVNGIVDLILEGAIKYKLITDDNKNDILNLGAYIVKKSTQLGLQDNHDIVQEILAARKWQSPEIEGLKEQNNLKDQIAISGELE